MTLLEAIAASRAYRELGRRRLKLAGAIERERSKSQPREDLLARAARALAKMDTELFVGWEPTDKEMEFPN